MKCEDCGDSDATVHFTEIINGEKQEMHLCEECARRKSIPMQKALSLSDLLQNLLSQVSSGEVEGELASVACPVCGMSYAAFRETGRFGCPNDYQVFRRILKDLLGKIQHDVRHVGKVPPAGGENLRRHNELIRLRRDLERAVQREEYEKAAGLRDRIAGLSRSIREDS